MTKPSNLLLAAALLGSIAATGAAAADPIAERRAILEGFGDATRPVAAMLRGEAPVDVAVAKAALATYAAGTVKLATLFPGNSRTGKTEASPRIWAQKERFDAQLAKLGSDAQAADAAITDASSLKANFPKVLANCKACHDDFREKK